LVSLIVLTAAAWALTLYHALSMREPMDGMSDMAMSGMSAAAGGSLASLGVFLAVWTIMMAAMMLPAAAPMIVVFATAQAGRTAVPTWIFVAGYLFVWVVTGGAVYVVTEAATLLSSKDRANSALLLGFTLFAAGLYQFTSIKRVCLNHCRSPLAFVAQYWRDGWLGALQMGMRHGTYCLGCCWALFAVLIVAGVMSLAWMLLLTLAVFVEKVLPQGQRISTAIGVAFVPGARGFHRRRANALGTVTQSSHFGYLMPGHRECPFRAMSSHLKSNTSKRKRT
jgi:predicted metal-binding membrane protein